MAAHFCRCSMASHALAPRVTRETRSPRTLRGRASHFAGQEDAPMKRRVLLTATLVVLGTIALTTTLAQAQTTSNGPYYATPSWDQKLQCDTLATCPRFIVLSNWNNEAVLDREAGLVWETSPATGRVTGWTAAREACINKRVGGRKGWRLPSVHELTSLLDTSTGIPTGAPFTNLQLGFSDFYWSATTIVDLTTLVWSVRLSFDGLVSNDVKTVAS